MRERQQKSRHATGEERSLFFSTKGSSFLPFHIHRCDNSPSSSLSLSLSLCVFSTTKTSGWQRCSYGISSRPHYFKLVAAVAFGVNAFLSIIMIINNPLVARTVQHSQLIRNQRTKRSKVTMANVPLRPLILPSPSRFSRNSFSRRFLNSADFEESVLGFLFSPNTQNLHYTSNQGKLCVKK